MKIRVYYEDTDAGGIVYHTRYINFCERARSEIFFNNGMLPTSGEKSGFVVRKINADFLGSAVLGDLLEVKSRLLSLKRTSTTLLQEVYKGEEKLFSMEILLVYMDHGKISRIPNHFNVLFQMIA
ncbi:MAG: YbgC/FadM family acyl-CoA thioesterase [Sulfurovum sp.]|nr:YbgC/FadM family acyl-CoA thioesterase [Sulfurovum sp.]